MNNTRRKELRDLKDQIEEIMNEIETLKEAEEEYRDNMPENMWGSERYEKAEEAISNLEFTMDSLDEAMEYIESSME